MQAEGELDGTFRPHHDRFTMISKYLAFAHYHIPERFTYVPSKVDGDLEVNSMRATRTSLQRLPKAIQPTTRGLGGNGLIYVPWSKSTRRPSLRTAGPRAGFHLGSIRHASSSTDAQFEEPSSTHPAVAAHTYLLTFTCKPCLTRSSHKVSGQAYHKGTVLIACPSCKNRHVISDHLKVCTVTLRCYLTLEREQEIGEERTRPILQRCDLVLRRRNLCRCSHSRSRLSTRS